MINCRLAAKFFAVVLGVAFCAAVYYRGEVNSVRAQSALLARMLATQMSCPDSSRYSFSGWGEVGYSKACIRFHGPDFVKNGPWEGWEKGRLRIRGWYREGKEIGKWEMFDEKKEVECSIEYKDDGVILSSTGNCAGWISQ